MRIVEVGKIKIGGDKPLVLIAGPCAIESEETVLRIGHSIKKTSERLGFNYILKSSYSKDNRTKIDSFHGVGIDEGLKILEKVKKELDVPLLSDVHNVEEARIASEILDIIQIPAFLSRQTSLLLAAAETGKALNVKKGQFMHPLDMQNIIDKIESAGNNNILLTERGSSYGYRTLVVDMRTFPWMRSLGYPVVFDPTHTTRNYTVSAKGEREENTDILFSLTRAGIAAGSNALFIETHDRMNEAKCDAETMLPLKHLEPLMKTLMEIDKIVKPEI